MMNFDDEDTDGHEEHLRIAASAKRKRTSQILTSDDETSCDDNAPISTLMRSRRDSVDKVKEDASRRSLTSAKTKRAGKISDDDETSSEDSVPTSTIKTRYRSKCTTGFQNEVQEDARKRRLTRLRKSEIKNEQDDKNSFDLKNSVCLQENSSSDDEEDNDALEDDEDYDDLEEEEDYDSVQDTEDDDGLEDEEDDDSGEEDGDYEGLEDEDDNDGSEEEEDDDGSEEEEDDDGLADEEFYDGEQDKEDNDSVEENDHGDNTNKSDAISDGEQDMDKSEVHSPNTGIAKPKRVTKIIASDDEISYDDSSPTTTLETQHNTRFSTGYEDEVKDDASKQCRPTTTKSESGKEQEEESSWASNQTIRLEAHSSSDEEDNDGSEDESASELDSLDGFIDFSHDEDEPIDANDFKATLKQIGRQKVSNVKWDVQASMLADFGKNPELCMKAVCALYRKQTADEKAFKVTRHRNKRGFSQVDATRGCELAEFLTEGSLDCDLNKTVEELKRHNFEWIELCQALAIKYSEQLFQIYRNKEDPYWNKDNPSLFPARMTGC